MNTWKQGSLLIALHAGWAAEITAWDAAPTVKFLLRRPLPDIRLHKPTNWPANQMHGVL